MPLEAAPVSISLLAGERKSSTFQGVADFVRMPHERAVPIAAAPTLAALWLLTLIWLVGCASFGVTTPHFERHATQPAADSAGYCAWYGDSDGQTLYFGESAFWASMRAAKGDPTADLGVGGPKRIGRFDLAARTMAPPMEVKVSAGSGVWDVMAVGERVYFTTFFGPAGFIDARTGAQTVFDGLGVGLNEIAPGPGQTLLASRYGSGDGGPGSVVVFGLDGALVAEYLLGAPEGFLAAPKTVAFDPVRREIWVTVDLVSKQGGASRQDARRLAPDGRELARIEEPEIEFVRFGLDGTGYLAARDGRALSLLVLETQGMRGDPLITGHRIALDPNFDPAFDFAQDIQLAADGRVVVTRWSGKVHVVDPPSGSVDTLQFPRDAQGLYYSAVLAHGLLCATHCAGVEVVCTAAPERARRKGVVR